MSSLFLKHHHSWRLPRPFGFIFSQRFKSSLSLLPPSFPSAHQSSCPDEGFSQCLTLDELTNINLLIPRLCFINQLPTAIRLTTAALLLPHPPPLHSLSLPVLIHSLSSQPDIALSTSLLARLLRSPPHLTPIATLLIVSYLRKRRPHNALQVFDDWLMRPGCPCLPHPTSLGILLGAFCRNGMVFEALKVLSTMLAEDLIPSSSLTRCLFRSLLREARIAEAIKLDEALGKARSNRTDGSARELASLIDRVFRDWTV